MTLNKTGKTPFGSAFVVKTGDGKTGACVCLSENSRKKQYLFLYDIPDGKTYAPGDVLPRPENGKGMSIDPDVVIEFTDVKSIDAVIQCLLEIRTGLAKNQCYSDGYAI
jgi:hypothetical protein